MEFLTQIADGISYPPMLTSFRRWLLLSAKIKLWNGNMITLSSAKSVNIVSQQVS